MLRSPRGARRSVPALLFALALLAGVVQGCGSVDRVILTSSPRLNMCDSEEPHPVVVRIYYLSGTSQFAAADFGALWDDDRAVLGDERIAVFERTLNPRQQLPVRLDRKDDAEGAMAIGVVANFCRPGAGGCWRKVVPITGRNAEIRIHLDEGCLSID